MEDKNYIQKYQKYKLRVKLWEKEFKKKFNRPPSKYDIREAPADVRDSYKMYYKLKTSFLEDTLNDALSQDGFDVFGNTLQAEEDFQMSVCTDDRGIIESSIPNLPKAEEISAIVKDKKFSNINELPTAFSLSHVVNANEDYVIKNFEATGHLETNDKAWQTNLSVAAKSAVVSKVQVKSKNLSQKLFKASSFSKRNPRKSLSRLNSSNWNSNTNLSENLDSNDSEKLPDLEMILSKKSKEQQTANAITANPLLTTDKLKDQIKTHVDEGWLNRTTIQNGIQHKVKTCKTEANETVLQTDTSKRRTMYGLSNINLDKLELNKLVSTNNNDVKNKELTVVEPLEEKNDKLQKKTIGKHISDSDSIVSESDEEEKPQEYRHIIKKRRILNETCKNENNIIEPIYNNEKPSSITETLDEEATLNLNKSTHDEDDNPLSPLKAIRKKTKPIKEKTKPSREKTTKTKKTENKKLIPKRDRKVNADKKLTRLRSSKLQESKGINVEDETEVEMPPNPQDLKYVLALETGEVISTPSLDSAELQTVNDMARKYINTINIPNQSSIDKNASKQIDPKRLADRKKLEAKINSGQLNENYRTIDLQKKIYARGKKHISFSKYKKKLWKNKKRVAALIGPDMDMGGCDGGELICFTCGKVGHFARDCKVKGDSLLPLTAQLEEDPSPFPTLAEAEEMAAKDAISVHSSNISMMPSAPNAFLYQKQEEEKPNDSSNISESDQSVKNDVYDFITDDELEAINLDNLASANNNGKNSSIKEYVGHKIPEEFLREARKFGKSDPYYELNNDGTTQSVTKEVLEALNMFGHSSFRKGQDRAVMRILSGLSTLVTLSTGSGKTLCYQLPAYLYSRQNKSITLVISPLVSLMEDQVTGVPHFLRAHCLHTNQTPQQRLKVQDLINKGEIDILLISPEAIVAGERSTGFGGILRQLPPIAFACIDEAHCVSQWSHNFRPSYLMVCKVLREKLGIKTILGLTATATLPTRSSIISLLGIPDGQNGIISDIPLPDNLILSVSKDHNRDFALVELLYSQRFDKCQSIIIYCTRRDDCERISGFLRTAMQDRKVPDLNDGGKRKRKRVNWHAEPYHAGMPASRRRTIQNAFMKNELRIVVATIAFGMGINKPDIRAVIHYNMPRNFESYVQEIGRAGRDGKQSHCHLFLDSNGNDQHELRRHIYANSIDRHLIRKLLQHVFRKCACDKNFVQKSKVSHGNEVTRRIDQSTIINETEEERICPGHEIGFSIEQTVLALDIPEENISTLLCYMELEKLWKINCLSSAYTMAKVISYGGAKYLKHAAKESPPLAMAIALEIKKETFKEDANIIEFSVIDIASAIGWNSGVVKYQLKNLEWIQVNGFPKRSPITVNFSDLGFRIKAPGDFTSDEIDNALDSLYSRSVKQEQTQLIQLQYVHQGLSSVAYKDFKSCGIRDFKHDRSDQLKAIVRDYFLNDYPKDIKLEIETTIIDEDSITNDVLTLINIYPNNNFTGRNIARIFHGIQSPNFPAVIWGRCQFWRAHCKSDFNRLVQLANAIIVKRRV